MALIKSDIGRYAITPEWILDSGISDKAVRLFSTLAAKYVDRESDKAWPSRSLLASDLKCSTDSIDRAVKQLEDIGALQVEHRQDNKTKEWYTNIYVVVFTRPPTLTDAATPSRTDAAQNQNQVNQNQEPETISSSENSKSEIVNTNWLEWFSLCHGIEGWKTTFETAEAWRVKNNVSTNLAEKKAYGLRDWWVRQPIKRRREGDPYATWQRFCREDDDFGKGNSTTHSKTDARQKYIEDYQRRKRELEEQKDAD